MTLRLTSLVSFGLVIGATSVQAEPAVWAPQEAGQPAFGLTAKVLLPEPAAVASR